MDGFEHITHTKVTHHLSMMWSRPIHIISLTPLPTNTPRNYVLRCQIQNQPLSIPSTVILKYSRPATNDAYPTQTEDESRFWSDWIGAQFLRERGCLCGPQWYGGLAQERLIVLEDLGSSYSPFQDLLFGTDRVAAERACIAFAHTLGLMQATTCGQSKQYQVMLQQLHSNATSFHRGFDDAIHLTEILSSLLPLPITFQADLAAFITAYEQPESMLALLHGDLCPSNLIFVEAKARIIDFEFSQIGFVLTDIACARMGFPTCGHAALIPTALIERMEAHYRNLLTPHLPDFEQDRVFFTALGNALTYWLLNSLGFHLPRILEQDRIWGISSERARILSRLNIWQSFINQHSITMPFTDIFGLLENQLRHMWPTQPELSRYPAFTQEKIVPTS